MIPGSFAYHRPASVSEAVALLAGLGDSARAIAGGHSLIPMMKLRLATPDHLVDLAGVAELKGIRADGNDIVIGAMTTQHEVVQSDLLAGKLPILRETSLVIADPQVRYVGTLGGNVANGDPGNDMPVIALASSIAALDHELLTVHMVQHVLMMTFAPPLIWLGAPVRALVRGVPQSWLNWIARLSKRPQLRRLGKLLGRPHIGWLAASGALVIWHIPTVFALGMKSELLHIVEQASFLVAGLMFWWPVIQPWPSTSGPDLSIILYLFFATIPCDILSGFLVFCDRVVYSSYLSSSHPLGFSALGDQQCAAALMWTCVTVVYFIAGTVLALRLLAPRSYREHVGLHRDLQTRPFVRLQNIEALHGD